MVINNKMELKVAIISAISCLLAGMGIGGGSLFIILGMIFLDYGQKMLQGLNLVMFITVGASATLSNIKAKSIDKKLVGKILPLLIVGSIVGTRFVRNIDEGKLKKYFLYLMTLIGIYEIITSLINMKKGKNNDI